MSASLVSTPSLFGDPAVDHAVAGFGAGTVATLVMHPLDLVKVRFQLADTPSASSPPASSSVSTPVASSSRTTLASSTSTSHSSSSSSSSSIPQSTSASSSSTTSRSAPTPSSLSSSSSGVTTLRNALQATTSQIHAPSPFPSTSSARPKPKFGRAVYTALADAVKVDGWGGLYRGLIPNLVGGAGSWGLYFLFYNLIKKRKQGGDPNYRTTSSQHLLAAAEASAVTAMLTNPIWVVKTRVFATAKNDPNAFKGLWDGLRTIYRVEGLRGLYRGSLLALVGVSNGSIQFAAYEEIKRRRTDLKQRLYERQGREWRTEDEKLTNTEYILASGGSKFMAIALTYPYQVVRARIQNAPAASSSIPRTSIPSVIRSTYANSGLIGFYKGLGTNAIRILPGTCLTFVVYENLVWGFRTLAVRREGSG